MRHRLQFTLFAVRLGATESVRVNDQRPPRGGSRAASPSSGRGPRVRISVDITISIFFRRLYVTCFIGRINSRRILATKLSLNYSRNGSTGGSGGSSSVNRPDAGRGSDRTSTGNAAAREQEDSKGERVEGDGGGERSARFFQPRQYFWINRSFMRQ